MTTLEIVELMEGMEAEYEEFLHGYDQALLYYSVKYKRFLTDLLGCRASYWIAVRASKIFGVLPMMAREGRWGTVWNSLPYFGSHGGVIAQEPLVVEALYKRYSAVVGAREVAAATVVTNPFAPSYESLIAFDTSDQRLGQVVRLEALGGSSPEEFWATVEASARRNIKKALASGVTVRIDNGAMSFLEACHRENMAAIGGKAKSPPFFRLIPKHFTAGKDYNIYVAEVGGTTVAALLLFYYNKTVEYFTPVVSANYRSFQPMALIIYTAMPEAARLGYVRWNWGGTWLSQTGLYRFKKKWNTAERPYKYYTKVNNQDLFRLTKAELMETYEGFYVLPLDAMR